ncbi:hypothetical protein, partial [Sphingomonas sp. CFBP 13706]|uniref:hypothetical protein n=1 Tax=Sphingomonas sp. CFBP 13706 TaxID=2775314 RepID=UPI001A7EDA69
PMTAELTQLPAHGFPHGLQDMRDILAGCRFRDWAGFRAAKAGQLRIPDFPCRSGHFGKSIWEQISGK